MSSRVPTRAVGNALRRTSCRAETSSSQARERWRPCLGTHRLPHAPAMAGSPIKRMRKAGVTNPVTGERIPFPYMPRVADLPPGWRHFTTAQKIEHLIGLDRCYEILSWPRGELDPLRRS